LWPAWSRHQSAIFEHTSTKAVSFTVDADQPTIIREWRSIAKAT